MITLRPWHINDKALLAQYANNKAISSKLTNKFPYPYTESDAEHFITMVTASEPVNVFAIEYNGALVGGIGYHAQDDIHFKNAELGYWVAEPFWNKGIISKTIPMVVAIAFAHEPIERVFARPFGSNIASQRVLEKCGFKLEAKFDKTFFKKWQL